MQSCCDMGVITHRCMFVIRGRDIMLEMDDYNSRPSANSRGRETGQMSLEVSHDISPPDDIALVILDGFTLAGTGR